MTVFTKLLATLNLLGFFVSIALFFGTWFGQGYIVGEAREYALEKAKVSLQPVVEILQNPITGNLPEPIRGKLRREI